MTTNSKSTDNETPNSNPSRVRPRFSRVSRGAAKSDAAATLTHHTHLQAPRSSVDRSPRSVTSKPAVDLRSPKLSTPPDKRPARILKPSELQGDLNLAQEELKKAKESLASVEKEKARALDDLKEAQKSAEEASEKLKEALMAQKRAEESFEIEKFRAVEMEQSSFEAAQRKEDKWQKEVEDVRSQHALDMAALLSAREELQKARQELAMTRDAKNQALDHADKATEIAEAHAEKVETLSAELVQLKSMLESRLETEANEKNELVAELDLEIETLKRELEKAKHYEETLMEKETIIEQLNVELEAARTAESYTQNLVKEWKKRVEELEVQAAEALRLERSASESLESVMKQLEDSNDLLHEAESEIESLKEKAGLLEISIGRQRGDLEESRRHLKTANEEASDLAKKLESLISEIEAIKEEKAQALNNEKLAADSVQKLLEEKNNLLDELSNAREEEERCKKAMESLASALHEVSSEARETKERLLSSQVEHENYESQIENLKLVLKATNEKYENMLGDAKQEIDHLSVAVENSNLDYQTLKAECKEKEINFINTLKRAEEKNSSLEKEITRLGILLKDAQEQASLSKDKEANLMNSPKKSESEVNHLKETLGDTKAESMKLKESLMEKESEVQLILQENEELRSREAESLKKAEELSKMLEDTKRVTEENGEVTDSEKDYDMLPKVVEFSEQNGGREVKNTPDNEAKEAENGLGDNTAKENTNKDKDDTDSVEVDFKMWESCKIEGKEFFPEELESKGENHDHHQNVLSSKENHDNASLFKQQSQKKKKPLLGKFGSLLKKKGTSNNHKL